MAKDILTHLRHELPIQKLVRGRSFEEQVEDIRREGTYGLPSEIRERLLGVTALGIPPPKQQAENVIIFGCMLLYVIPLSLRNYLRLLDLLGVEYTFLKKEYCCGLLLVETSGQMDRAKAVSKEFMGLNVAMAQELGAKNVVHFCNWCAHLSKLAFPDGPLPHLYYPDIILDKLQTLRLRVEPTVIGFYEGCQKRNRAWAPEIELNWKAYRQVLDRIEGLKVIDLPRSCCILNPDKILEKAENLDLQTIVCSCPTCHVRLTKAAGSKVRMLYYPDLLLHTLEDGKI